MNEKKYSVSDLDALRTAVERKWLWGRYGGPSHGGSSRSYREEVKVKSVEELVRTHMLAGHTAEDLYASEAVASQDNGGANG